MMIYIFGDLRQLRTFELSRPPISRPQPVTISPRNTTLSPSAITTAPITRPPILPLDRTGRRSSIVPPPPLVLVRDHCPLTRTSTASSGTIGSSETYTPRSTEEEAGQIEISSAYFHDEEFQVGDITAVNTPTAPEAKYTSYIANGAYQSRMSSFMTTASFIHPYEPTSDDAADRFPKSLLSEPRQSMSPFDFDSLPRLSPPSAPFPALSAATQHSHSQLTPNWLLARAQEQCHLSSGMSKIATDACLEVPPTCLESKDSLAQRNRRDVSSATAVHAQFKKVRAVPAFSSPLTRVLNPVVVRGQWEIVVRSAFIALLVSWIVLGCLLTVPD